MAATDGATATETEVGSNDVPSESAQPSHSHVSSYATMSHAYGNLGHLPFGVQPGCIVPADYTSAIPRIEGLQDLAAYQSNVNAQMAHYQTAHVLSNPSSFPADSTAKLLKTRSVYGLGTVNPGQRHGRWSEDEHQQFLNLMQKYGRSWTKVRVCVNFLLTPSQISQVMMTRSEPQVRSHAQKHFLRVSRLEKQAAAEGKQALEVGLLQHASQKASIAGR
mmetsp:Transcript_25405/g.82164  ORF Transcript_25405/g.82164 Transcript_25405/m.82164 type:complete len:220 (-) Transcript_25405:1679-2338(-)